MKPGDRLVCAFVESPDEGAEFKDWPLHVTVVPWFRIKDRSGALATEIHDKLEIRTPFHVVIGDETEMGHSKTVNLVGCPTHFTEIEEQVRDILKAHDAWLVDETTKKPRDYRPHVTAQKDDRLYRGDTFICEALFIVEQKGGHKKVVAKIGLGDEAAA
ncbi:MAG TPA: 2'-5' RNA ligase family protein [Candidatus Saccharimonadia bacterium]|nr:2'-5' RNA ligase family protein [Candidatus Saccharimonadia bacterium]